MGCEITISLTGSRTFLWDCPGCDHSATFRTHQPSKRPSIPVTCPHCETEGEVNIQYDPDEYTEPDGRTYRMPTIRVTIRG